MAYKPMPFGNGLFLFLMGSRLAEDAPETGLSTFPWRTCSQLLRRYVF
jgi:hypothetical protein